MAKIASAARTRVPECTTILDPTGQFLQSSHPVSCHYCGFEQDGAQPRQWRRARCGRCRSTLRIRRTNSIQRSLALSVCGLLLFIPALTQPIMSFGVAGRFNNNWLASGVVGLFDNGAHVVAGLVLLTSIACPFLRFVLATAVLAPIALGAPQRSSRRLLHLLEGIDRWAMLDVYLLAVAVAYAKLSNFGAVDFQQGGLPLLGIILLSILLSLTFDPDDVRECTRRSTARPHKPAVLSHLTRTEALLITAAVLYVPSYIYPVLSIVEYGKVHHDTVYGSILELTSGGQYLLGVLVFCASMIIPTLKILILAGITLSIRFRWRFALRDRLMLYRLVEAIGRWSFVDLFVVSILIALAELGVMATVTPGPGLILFAGVVVSTMLAALTLDPRLIWQCLEE